MARLIYRGDRIQELREKMGFNVDQLAERLGVTSSYLKAIEYNKRTPSPRIFGKLCAILKSNPEYIFGFSDAPDGIYAGSSVEAKDKQLIEAMRRGDYATAVKLLAED